MRLTTKGRFAVIAMLDLALSDDDGPVALASISRRQHISLSYLEQLFGRLRRHALVRSTRGPGGGYTLGRKASAITVADIIVSVDEPLDATQCGGRGNCCGQGSAPCMTHDLWSALNRQMVDYLDSIDLQQLVDHQHEREQQQGRSVTFVSRSATVPEGIRTAPAAAEPVPASKPPSFLRDSVVEGHVHRTNSVFALAQAQRDPLQ